MNDSEIIKAYEEEISKPQNHYIGTVGILWNILDLIKRQQERIEKLESIQLKQGNTIGRLREEKYECIGTIDIFKKKFELADETINKIEDDLDRGNDNSWAREHIDEYRKGDDNER